MRTVIAALLLTGPAAFAAHSTSHTSAIGGKATHVKLSPVVDGQATLELVVVTASKDQREVLVPIDLPPGLVATGLRLEMAGSSPQTANPFVAKIGHERYTEIVDQMKDPALLEWTPTGLWLRVFPVVEGEPATITIRLATEAKVTEANLVAVDGDVSLVCAPDDTAPRDRVRSRVSPYDDYWPSHED